MDNKMNALDRPIDHNGRDPFYLGASLFSLVIVLVGFSPGFYLQEVFELPELPLHLVVHGTVLTGWFFLACLQPALVRFRKTRLHRRTGIAGLLIAAAVVITGVWTVVMRDATTIDEFPTRAAGNSRHCSCSCFVSRLAPHFVASQVITNA